MNLDVSTFVLVLVAFASTGSSAIAMYKAYVDTSVIGEYLHDPKQSKVEQTDGEDE